MKKIVAISDLHGHFPEVPKCDLLLVGGDICPDIFGRFLAKHSPEHQLAWFENTWIPKARNWPAKKILVTWGNHDFCGHLKPNGKYGKKVQVITDRLVEVKGLKIWMTPWSNQFMDWAWMKEHEKLAEVYNEIPEGLDVLVSHQPPFGCGDWYSNEHIGSSELLYVVETKKPKMVVCGHLHKGFGEYEVEETRVYNVSVVNEGYQLVHPATIIDLEEDNEQPN